MSVVLALAVYALSGSVVAADLVWSADLEGDDAGFSAAGETGQWEWDEVTTGPAACFTGVNCWATLPQGAYLHEATDYLIFPVLDLTALAAPTLTFSHWMEIAPIDLGTVEAQVAGVWTRLDPAYGYTDVGGYSSSTAGWETVYFSLADLGESAALRISFVTGNTGFGSGWYVDDFAVYDGDIVPPSVTDLTELSDTEDVDGPYVVTATVVDDVGLESVRLEFAVDDGTVVQTTMTDLGGGIWEGQIPGQQSGHEITYWVVAADSENETVAPVEGWTFSVRLAPPTDLEGPDGLVHGPTATLAWGAPESIFDLEGYSVYRDEELVLEVTDPTAAVPLVTGDQSFTVTAVYDVGESAPTEPVEVSAAVPEVISVSPEEGYQGDTIRVEIVSSYLLMVDEEVALDLGDGVTVSALDVRDVDTLVATLSIDETAESSMRDVAITAGGWEVAFVAGFEVLSGEARPRIDSVDPADLTQGESTKLVIVATHPFAEVPLVSLGEGVVIEEVALLDDQQTLEVDLAVAWNAALGERVLEVDDGVRVLDDQIVWVRDYVVEVPRGGCSTTADSAFGGGWLVALLIGIRRRHTMRSGGQDQNFVNGSSSRKA